MVSTDLFHGSGLFCGYGLAQGRPWPVVIVIFLIDLAGVVGDIPVITRVKWGEKPQHSGCALGYNPRKAGVMMMITVQTRFGLLAVSEQAGAITRLEVGRGL